MRGYHCLQLGLNYTGDSLRDYSGSHLRIIPLRGEEAGGFVHKPPFLSQKVMPRVSTPLSLQTAALMRLA